MLALITYIWERRIKVSVKAYFVKDWIMFINIPQCVIYIYINWLIDLIAYNSHFVTGRAGMVRKLIYRKNALSNTAIQHIK